MAELSKNQKQIVGLYLNDFYGEIESVDKGGRSEQQFRQTLPR
jgi:hypothetical protein